MKHLLLIPTDATQSTLLAEGPCGARVPVVLRWLGDGNIDWRLFFPGELGIGDLYLRALPLIWNGEHTGELGIVRAMLMSDRVRPISGARWMHTIMKPTAQSLMWVAEDGAKHGLWTVEVVE